MRRIVEEIVVTFRGFENFFEEESHILEAFSKNNDQKNLLFVCHSSVIKSMIQYVTGAPEEDKDIYGVTMSSIGVTEIEYNENTGYDLKYANREVI